MRTAIMISGRGSTLQALLDLASTFRISVVVSSKAHALGLLRARRAGVPVLVLDKKIDYELLHQQLRSRGIERIFLAGFMKILPASFIERWKGRIINVHPSLLPLYPGLKAFETSHAEQNEMGVSLHEVTAELDGGPIVRQLRFYHQGQWKKHQPSLAESQINLSFTEQRLVRETAKVWK